MILLAIDRVNLTYQATENGLVSPTDNVLLVSQDLNATRIVV
jgi:hypothetical protein